MKKHIKIEFVIHDNEYKLYETLLDDFVNDLEIRAENIEVIENDIKEDYET